MEACVSNTNDAIQYNHYIVCILLDRLLQNYRDCHLVLAGDGQCDLPGNSAKLCTYSLMDTGTNKVLHAETVDKREVHLQSPNMEREDFTSIKFFAWQTSWQCYC